MTIEQLLKNKFIPSQNKLSEALEQIKLTNNESSLISFLAQHRGKGDKEAELNFDNFVATERIFINERVENGKTAHDSLFFIPVSKKISLSQELIERTKCLLGDSGLIEEDVKIDVYEDVIALTEIPTTWYGQKELFAALENGNAPQTVDGDVFVICGKITLIAEEDEHPCTSPQCPVNSALTSEIQGALCDSGQACNALAVVFDPTTAHLVANCFSHGKSIDKAEFTTTPQVSIQKGACILSSDNHTVALNLLPRESYFENSELETEIKFIEKLISEIE